MCVCSLCLSVSLSFGLSQMSRMLDVLEEFLTLHGHTYVRLDGSTGVEKRQRLMDRYSCTVVQYYTSYKRRKIVIQTPYKRHDCSAARRLLIDRSVLCRRSQRQNPPIEQPIVRVKAIAPLYLQRWLSKRSYRSTHKRAVDDICPTVPNCMFCFFLSFLFSFLFVAIPVFE